MFCIIYKIIMDIKNIFFINKNSNNIHFFFFVFKTGKTTFFDCCPTVCFYLDSHYFI